MESTVAVKWLPNFYQRLVNNKSKNMQNIFKLKFYNNLTCSLKSGNAFLTQPHSGYGLFSEWVLTQTVDIRYR